MMKFKIIVIVCNPPVGKDYEPYLLYGFVSKTGRFYSFGDVQRGFLPYSLIPEIIEDLSHFFKKDVAYDTFSDYKYSETIISAKNDEILYEETIYVPSIYIQ